VILSGISSTYARDGTEVTRRVNLELHIRDLKLEIESERSRVGSSQAGLETKILGIWRVAIHRGHRRASHVALLDSRGLHCFTGFRDVELFLRNRFSSVASRRQAGRGPADLLAKPDERQKMRLSFLLGNHEIRNKILEETSSFPDFLILFSHRMSMKPF
jgi:hypothetical protein